MGDLWVADVPRYVINLDAPPEDRWNDIIVAFREHLPAAVAMADQILGGAGSSVVEPVLSALARCGHVYYGAELKGIAKASGLPLGRVVMLQIAYEAFAACTSIVVDGADGHPLHIRTMDWEMEALKALTVELDFVRAGEVVCRASSWAGYVGVLTGLRPGAFSVSVNYRRTERGSNDPLGALLTNVKRGAVRHWPVSFLVREVLTDCGDFRAALGALASSELMAPTYLTLCGTQTGEGAIITRGRVGGGEETIAAQLRDGPLVQVNMDIPAVDANSEDDDWQDICASRRRRRFALEALGGLAGPATMEDLWLLQSCPPCLAHDTVYTTAMVPATGLLATRVHATNSQRLAGRQRFGDVARSVAASVAEVGAMRQ